jgi:hypothetical protein
VIFIPDLKIECPETKRVSGHYSLSVRDRVGVSMTKMGVAVLIPIADVGAVLTVLVSRDEIGIRLQLVGNLDQHLYEENIDVVSWS